MFESILDFLFCTLLRSGWYGRTSSSLSSQTLIQNSLYPCTEQRRPLNSGPKSVRSKIQAAHAKKELEAKAGPSLPACGPLSTWEFLRMEPTWVIFVVWSSSQLELSSSLRHHPWTCLRGHTSLHPLVFGQSTYHKGQGIFSWSKILNLPLFNTKIKLGITKPSDFLLLSNKLSLDRVTLNN